jgi:hypothetical protein
MKGSTEGWKRKPPSTRRTEVDGGTIGRMVLGEHHTHHIGSPMQARCQEKAEPKLRRVFEK